jgi:hypothetical protein
MGHTLVVIVMMMMLIFIADLQRITPYVQNFTVRNRESDTSVLAV